MSLPAILKHFLLPRHSNNQRAKLLHFHTVVLLALFFLVSGFFLAQVKTTHPQVLGASIDISSQELLLLTNQYRQKAGVGPLAINDQLSVAAHRKADYMFAKDFWAHIAPDGTTPWDFIKQSGYSYIYAGENLARGFSSTADVVNAWMASPDHRENMLSKNYQDVGFAVEEGTLTGEKDTILVVEMFGGKNAVITEPSASKNYIPRVLAQGIGGQSSLFVNSPVINSFALGRNVTLFLLSLFIIVFTVDALVIERKKISRLVGHNIDHVVYLAGIFVLIILLTRGTIF